jgi:hypothetical protein
MPNALGWLTQFDVESSYAPRRVDVVHPVKCGERRDFFWVRLDPPIAPGEAANREELDSVLLASRHEGHPLTVPVAEETHVYVCRIPGATGDLPPEVDPSEVEILHWGIVAPSASG